MGQRIRHHRRELGLNQQDLARAAGLSQGFLSALEKDRRKPGSKTLLALASALELPAGVLLGGGEAHDNPQPYEPQDIPLFGSIPAGPPSESQEAIESWPVLKHLWSKDLYCLRLSFDSMEPTLKPGDIVLVQYRAQANPAHLQGRICACLIDGQPTLKRVLVEKRAGKRRVTLRGDNPDTPALRVRPAQDFSIQGVVIKLVARDL